jgi:hypothetical protein
MPADPRLRNPDPQIRLQAWHELATGAGITADTVDRLARHGFTEAARGLAAAIAAPTDDRGQLLGRLQTWGLDVYEGSPPEWVDALMQERSHHGPTD